jgi:hypothetical protein
VINPTTVGPDVQDRPLGTPPGSNVRLKPSASGGQCNMVIVAVGVFAVDVGVCELVLIGRAETTPGGRTRGRLGGGLVWAWFGSWCCWVEQFEHLLGWVEPLERFARPAVELRGDRVESCLVVNGEV